MNLNNVDISKLPADVRKQFKQLQVMHAERKIQNKAKSDFLEPAGVCRALRVFLAVTWLTVYRQCEVGGWVFGPPMVRSILLPIQLQGGPSGKTGGSSSLRGGGPFGPLDHRFK